MAKNGSLVTITLIADRGDVRGSYFPVPRECLGFLEKTADIHVVTCKPGAKRGNHSHCHRREMLIVFGTGSWAFYWDEGPGTEVRSRTFDGTDGAILEIKPPAAHALHNCGDQVLYAMAVSDDHDQAGGPTDLIRRELV